MHENHSGCVVFIAMSLDGFIASKDHGLQWLSIVEREGEDYGYKAFMDSIDSMIIGRNTYEAISGFGEWPYTGKKVIVATHRDIKPIADEWACSGSVASMLAALHKAGCKKTYLDGGQMVQQGLREGLVKEMTISVIPILLGEGIPLFGDLGQVKNLKLVATKAFPSSLVQITYSL